MFAGMRLRRKPDGEPPADLDYWRVTVAFSALIVEKVTVTAR
jgi:hypothetical protein